MHYVFIHEYTIFPIPVKIDRFTKYFGKINSVEVLKPLNVVWSACADSSQKCSAYVRLFRAGLYLRFCFFAQTD